MFDLVLAGGRVVDGTGCPWFRADVGIAGARIAAVGNLAWAEAGCRLDVRGRVVCPGFVDAHVHGDLALLADPHQEHAIHQGVTTYIIGQDGCGLAPASPATSAYMRQYTAGFTGSYPELVCDWSSVGEYLDRLTGRTSVNAACLVPNGAVRMEIMGLANRLATASELEAMCRLVRESMEQGAVGLSTGLDYIPSLYADTAEITELCRTLVPYDGVYVTHMRAHRGRTIPEAIEEVLAIGRGTGCALHISHFGVKAEEHLPRIDWARQQGLDLSFDTYPYLAGMTLLAMVALPTKVQEGGVEPTLQRLAEPRVREEIRQVCKQPQHSHEAVRLAHIAAERYRELEGLSLASAARRTGLDVGELICELLRESHLAVSVVVQHAGRSEADLIACMKHAAQMGSSDGIFTGRFTHPRGWGAFARFLGEYVREKHAWSLEEAVRHLSYHACRRFRLPDRGLVRPGMVADLVVFDPQRIADRATFDEPRQLAIGVEHVLVGGKLTLQDGRHTGVTNGVGLR